MSSEQVSGKEPSLVRKLYRWFYWKFVYPVTMERFLRASCRGNPAKLATIRQITPYTMVGLPRLLHTYSLAQDIEDRRIEGAFIECGVWKGGCVGLMASVSKLAGSGRKIWLFDSFEGLPEPVAEDGDLARAYSSGRATGALKRIDQCVGDRGIVEDLLFRQLEIDRSCVEIRQGWFQDTVFASRSEVGPIAILRLDGDWYESTKVCLEAFFDQITPGGYLILDDYGYWEGCRRATDEFLAARGLSHDLKMVDAAAAFLRKR